MKKVKMYTDGSCKPTNPGPGGVGIILEYEDEKNWQHKREISQGYRLTTNNRMEIMAVIVGLEALKYPCEVQLVSDSQYTVRAINEWLSKWAARGWRRSGSNEPVANVDLWQKIIALRAVHQLSALWTKGHAADMKNQRCDELARAAVAAGNLLEDEGYQAEGEVSNNVE